MAGRRSGGAAMNAFTRALSFLYFRFKTIFKNKTNFFALLALPVVVFSSMWLFGRFYASGGQRIPVGVTDNDKSDFSKLVIDRLKSQSAAVQVDEYEYEEAEKLVMAGKLEAAIIINQGFMENLVISELENLVEIIHSPSSMARSFIVELVTPQISRLRFNCDAAQSVVVAAGQGQNLSEDESKALWDEAFAFADAYWEPEPLMTADYRPVEARGHTAQPDGQAAVPVGTAGSGGAAGYINSLISNVISIIAMFYFIFCLIISAGVIINERDNGLAPRLKSTPRGYFLWAASTVAVPAATYAALLCSLLFLPGDLPFTPLVQIKGVFPSLFALSMPASHIFVFLLLLLPACALTSGVGYALALRSKSYHAFRLKAFAAAICLVALTVVLGAIDK